MILRFLLDVAVGCEDDLVFELVGALVLTLGMVFDLEVVVALAD